MILYTIQPAIGTIYPQIQKMKEGYNYKSYNSVHALSRKTTEFPDFIPDLDHFVLSNRTGLSDMLSTSVINTGGFLISEKFKNVIENFKIIPHKFYEAKVLYKKSIFPYYWFHAIGNMYSFVDYKKSKFFIYHNFSHNIGYINIDSFEDYIIKKEKIKKDNPTKTVTIWAEKIFLNEDFDKTLDFFEVGIFNSQYFISEKLKFHIEKNNITGVLIKENLIIKS